MKKATHKFMGIIQMKMFGNDYVKQHDTRDCAAACMASVCNLYGLHISLLHMRELLKIDKNGTSMYALMEVANKVGFSCEVLQGNWQEFSGEILERKICLPAICHMHIDGLEHFVIVKKVTNKGIWIFDPAKGHIKYSPELFESQWTGYVLNLYSVNIEKEIRKKKKKSFQYMDILISLRWKFVFILLISFLIAGISIIYSYFYQKIIDQFILHESNYFVNIDTNMAGVKHLLQEFAVLLQYLPYLFGMMIFMILFQFVLAMIRGKILATVENKVDIFLSKKYVSNLVRLPFSYFQQWETGDIMGRYQDMDFVRNAISGSVLTITFETVMAIAGFFILIRINTRLFLIIVGMLMVYLIIVLLYRKPMQQMNRDIMEADAKVTSGIKEGIDGIETVKLFAQEESYGTNIVKRMNQYISLCYKGNMLSVSEGQILAVVQGIGMVLVLWCGTSRVIYGDMTLGTLFLFASLMNYFISPVQNLIGLQPQLQEACIAMDRLNDILNATPEKKLHSGTLSPVDICGTIHYDGVSFRYGYRKWVFQQVTFSVNEGEHVALTGTNGSGKSTLARLLVGMYEPDTGIITIGGQKISEIELECLRKHIIYVSQIPVLLSGTIREGLLFGCTHSINDELFERIAHGCGVDEIIRDNPFGYDWILTENGMNVSGGHRQRIAIARALLAEPDILILDEATSQIDRDLEEKILQFVFEYRKGKTILVITHNEKIIHMCDRELCIDLLKK